jgi:DNA-binding LytR/AlgR family response regulator
MGYRVGICDDSTEDADFVERIVTSWAKQNQWEITVERFPSAEAFLFCYAQDKEWDILLLDIEMGKMDGVELAKQIRQDNSGVQMVFITGFADYMAQGYEVSALHYLMKPVAQDKLFAVLDKAAQNRKKTEKVLLLPVDAEMIRLRMSEICFVEAQAHSVRIATRNGMLEVRRSISELEWELDQSFVRCHRSYLVNLKYLAKLCKNEVVLDDGTVLPLSRGAAAAVHKAFVAYYTEGEE